MKTKPALATVFEKGSYKSFAIDIIIRLQSDGGYVDVYLADGTKKITCNSLAQCQRRLKRYSFCRIHQSHLVKLKHVKEIVPGKTYMAVMSDNSQVPVSRRLKAGFLSHFIFL